MKQILEEELDKMKQHLFSDQDSLSEGMSDLLSGAPSEALVHRDTLATAKAFGGGNKKYEFQADSSSDSDEGAILTPDSSDDEMLSNKQKLGAKLNVDQ